MWQFLQHPPEYLIETIKTALLLLIFVGGSMALVSVAVLRFGLGGLRSRVNGTEQDITQIKADAETRVVEVTKDFGDKLDAKEKEFIKQVKSIAEGFALREAGSQTTIKNLTDKLAGQDAVVVTLTTERTTLQETLQNLNARIDDLEGVVTSQGDQIKSLQELVREKDKKERELTALNRKYAMTIGEINDEKIILQAEKKILFEAVRVLGIDYKKLQVRDDPPDNNPT